MRIIYCDFYIYLLNIVQITINLTYLRLKDIELYPQ